MTESDKRERAIRAVMSELDADADTMTFRVTYRYQFDDGRYFASEGGRPDSLSDERARRQLAEAVLDERHRLRMARLNNQTAIERLESELAAVKAERDARLDRRDGQPADPATGSPAVDAIAGAVRALQRAVMLHTMELPVSITMELSPPAYFTLGRMAQETRPMLMRWREFFLLDQFTGHGPVVVKPGDRMPDVPDEIGEKR